jgi:hypothetical protein
MVDRPEFDRIAAAVAAGTFTPRIEVASSPLPSGERAG